MASRKRFKTTDVLQMLESDDEYFEEDDSDHQVNERVQDCEAAFVTNSIQHIAYK